jgi:hypothetical protein
MANSTYSIKCSRCAFFRDDISVKSDAKRHASAHEGIGAGHKVEVKEQEPLSKTVRKGDRIRLKESARAEYAKACEVAGYELRHLFDVHQVTRIDHFGTGGRPRLFIEAPPYAFYPSDVELAWNSDKERREGLGL